ncbi:MAG: histidine--tRNA ligase [Gemmatimonadaceae bacterium]|jgi:histidyl-tRNA synthetase|nr:histidine--tRNA ligase [Gemmatimonadaceae bacterium]MCC6429298.1 histidine--tRNA ligase [Gemmatimonadaceae bacterium]
MPPKPLPGFRDFYPEQLAERAHLFDTWRRVVRRYAFVEYDGPPLEPLDLYTQKSGDEIVTQLYNFVDKGDRAVALRPEMTPTFARMVGARAQTLRKPVRWFTMPQLFRYERTQKGRLREHFQLNVDIVGEADVMADAELLSIAVEIMRALGLSQHDVRARVSDRRLLNALLEHLGIAPATWHAVYAVLDKLERQPRDVSAEKLDAAGLSPQVRDAVLGFATLDFAALRATYGESAVVQPHVARFAEYLAHTEALGIAEWIRFDLTIVRGLAYYTGIVFELFDAVGEFRAICGGGRYDNLLASLGGTDLPALGFGMGDVVLGELLRARGKMPAVSTAVDVWIAQSPDDASYPRRMLATATQLRADGLSVEYAFKAQRVDKQFEAARKAGARHIAILTDVSDGGAQVRVVDADRHEQHFDSIEAFARWASSTTGTTP